MQIGTVIKKYNGYYYVHNGEETIECKIRGKLKKERFSLCVGDRVIYAPLAHQTGAIERIEKRFSLLHRPPVANIDQVFMMFSAKSPDIKPLLIDRFLVLGEYSRLKIFLCITKFELADSQTEALLQLYQEIGYDLLRISSVTGQGLDETRTCLKNKTTVFSGPSGVGKSTLLNAIEQNFQLKTGVLSDKIQRGKHTTRFAELFPLSEGGFVVDTPGFSFTEFQMMQERELALCFPEFQSVDHACKYNTCLHLQEPGCAIKEAVENTIISKSRYESYLNIVSEIKQRKKGFS